MRRASSGYRNNKGNPDMRNALIIGASRGIGHEFAAQLAADKWTVYAGARDEQGLQCLHPLGVRTFRLDVTNPESLAELEWRLESVRLDLAVYVAGVFGPRDHADQPPSTADFDRVMHTNV